MVGMAFVFFPRAVQVDSIPHEIVFHDLKGTGVVKVRLTEGDAISEEIRRFLAGNNTGWRIIIRQLSLGETAPSIEIFGEDNSYELSVWRNEAVLGFWKTKKSYRKKINPDFHARLMALITEDPRKELNALTNRIDDAKRNSTRPHNRIDDANR
jgi:hypothetical protein